MARVATEPPPSLTTLRPDVPRRLALVVARCLAKTPGERFAGYPALTAALEPFSSTQLKPAPLFRRLARRLDRSLRRRPADDRAGAVLRLSAVERVTSRRSGARRTHRPHRDDPLLRIVRRRPGRDSGQGALRSPRRRRGQRAAGDLRGIMRALAFGAPVQIVTRTRALADSERLARCRGGVGRQDHRRRQPGRALFHGPPLERLYRAARSRNRHAGRAEAHSRSRRASVAIGARAEAVLAAPGETRIGPYLVPDGDGRSGRDSPSRSKRTTIGSAAASGSICCRRARPRSARCGATSGVPAARDGWPAAATATNAGTRTRRSRVSRSRRPPRVRSRGLACATGWRISRVKWRPGSTRGRCRRCTPAGCGSTATTADASWTGPIRGPAGRRSIQTRRRPICSPRSACSTPSPSARCSAYRPTRRGTGHPRRRCRCRRASCLLSLRDGSFQDDRGARRRRSPR